MKILVVEDEPNNMMLIKIILKKCGHESIEAFTGKEGIRKASGEFNGLIQKPINTVTIMDEIKKIVAHQILSYPTFTFIEEHDRTFY
jgi:DNA-binding response OmpR family regulator